MALDIAKIRNIGFVGHGGVGKTSLVEGMLHAAGAVSRLGRVDDGTTTTDFDPDEIKRKISLSTAVAFCDYKGHRLNLVDTPGYGDFVSDARAGLRAVGAAVEGECMARRERRVTRRFPLVLSVQIPPGGSAREWTENLSATGFSTTR